MTGGVKPMKTLQTSCTPRREALVVLALAVCMGISGVLSLCLGAVGLTPGELAARIQEVRT